MMIAEASDNKSLKGDATTVNFIICNNPRTVPWNQADLNSPLPLFGCIPKGLLPNLS